MSKIGVKTLIGMHLLDVNVSFPNYALSYTHGQHQVIDILCRLCCYYLCKEYVKHCHKLVRFVVGQHRIINNNTVDNGLEDCKVTYDCRELHSDNVNFENFMNWFPHSLKNQCTKH